MTGHRQLALLVEGQTEETLVRQVLGPYLQDEVGFSWVQPIVIPTRRSGTGPAARGGVGSWPAVEKALRRLLTPAHHTVSTLIDYYALPLDAPGMSTRPAADARARVRHVEEAIGAQLRDERLVPHVVLHEIETWVLASLDHSGAHLPANAVRQLQDAVAAAGEPELVNDDPNSAPSKRILRASPTYGKIQGAAAIIGAAGFPHVLATCPHTRDWVDRLRRRLA
ncbi:MAG: DUF4276 family protein [Kineosporiaceae bacterium]